METPENTAETDLDIKITVTRGNNLVSSMSVSLISKSDELYANEVTSNQRAKQ